MELSVSTPFKLRTKHTDQLYYGQFRYCLSFRQPELYCLRKLPGADELNRIVDQRKGWESISPYGDDGLGSRFPDQIVKELHNTQDLLLASPDPIKFIISYNYGYLYTNNLKFIEQLWTGMPYSKRVSVIEARVTKKKDLIVLHGHKYPCRTYFREGEWTQDMKKTVHQWVVAQQGEVVASAVMHKWLTMDCSNWRWNEPYCKRYHYVDHTSEQYITMLRMMFSEIVRKTIPIENRYK